MLIITNFASMIYPKNFERKIGFDLVKQKLLNLCISPLGQSYVEKIRFNSQFDLITKLLNQVNEFKQILSFSENFPSQDYFDLRLELRRIKVPGTIIEIESLFDLKSSLITIHEIIKFFKKTEEGQFEELKELVGKIILDELIIKKITLIVDDKGKIKDTASPKLKEIRFSLIKKHKEIDRQISNSLKQAKKEGWTDSDVEPTFRNNRLVIPVVATYKRKLKGFIHDESATGQTVYIEPAEIFDANNEIRELENAERREIIKILIDFTDYLRPQLDDLFMAYRILGQIDFIRAKAKFAIEIEANKPVIFNKPWINWVNSKHPLLYLSLKDQDRELIPLTIKLDEVQRILIVSGPNAGGKSVCLKTVGLNQYMLQCGLLPALNEVSEAGIFDKLFIDIGDEQSLENDLSTYSSHLLNIKHFVLNSDKNTLFLIDEFGTGTEPQLGGAIAESALEKLNENGSYGVITTHYANLKLLADKSSGIINGAMLFDTKEIKPLYQLVVGKPGSSFAFEIAKNIGFPKSVLKNAIKKTGKTQLDFEQQLQQLEIDKKEILKKEAELKVADDFLKEITEKYETLLKKTEESKEVIIKNAKAEAKELIDGSNKLIEHTIKEIKESQANKEKTKKLRAEVKERSEILKMNEPKVKPNKNKIKSKNTTVKQTSNAEVKIGSGELLKIGDSVKVGNQETIGELLEISGKDVLVSFNSIQVRTKLKSLQKISKTQTRKGSREGKSNYSSIINQINEKMAKFNMSIDVRGKRAEEALTIVRDYVDEAILLNVKEVNILHGKGDGILRKIIREYLSSITEIKSYKNQHIEFGGDGITIITFK
jgi:DNA mismatch repair protein MutS2